MVTRLLGTVVTALVVLSLQGVGHEVSADPGGTSDSTVVLRLTGDVEVPLSLTLEQLSAMAHHEAQTTIHGRTSTYQGVPLGELLGIAKAPTGKDLIRSVVFVRAADGYEAVFSLAELSDDFTDHEVLVADAQNGGPLPPEEAPLRLVVAGEKRAARAVRSIKEIEVRILP